MTDALSITGLTHAYAGGRLALDNLSLAIPQGRIFGILGPNGSGKTTLFRILSTLIEPQSGAIVFDFGDGPLALPADRMRIRPQLGVVFQAPSLDKELSAAENLRHHGHLYGLGGPDLRSRIEASLQRFGLHERRNERVKKFSGGMRRRVELAKGLLNRPRMLILDEPSTGLDPAARIDLWRALEEIRAESAVTILLTTHLMEEADKCARLAIFDAGKVVALGAPDELKSSIGGEIITLQSAQPDALQALIRQKLNVEPQRVDSALRIERPDAPAFIPALFAAAPDLIQSVSVARPTLEDVFIGVTGRRFAHEA